MVRAASLMNWELSVLIPFEADSEAELEAKASELAMYERPLVKVSARSPVDWQGVATDARVRRGLCSTGRATWPGSRICFSKTSRLAYVHTIDLL